MASTPSATTSSATSTPAAVDSAALRPCPKCRRRMSSLKHDSHTICSQCRAVSCSVETRCSECSDWSIDTVQEHLKYQCSLVGKRGSRKPAVTAASDSQPAVASSPVVSSPPSATPSVGEAPQLKDAVLAVLQSLQGSLGINLASSTAPSTVPDSAPSVGEATGGVHVVKLHNVDSCLESPGVCALELPAQNPAKSTSLVVLPHNVTMLQTSARHYLGMGTVTASDVAMPLGPSPSPLGSAGTDQLRVQGLGPLSSSSSSALSPTSLLFTLTPSPSLPPPSFLVDLGFCFPSSSFGVVSPLFFFCLLSSFFSFVFFLSLSYSFPFLRSLFLILSFLSFLFLRDSIPSSFCILALPFLFFFPFLPASFFFLCLFPFAFSSFLFRLCPLSLVCPSSWLPCFLFPVFLFLRFVSSSPSSSFAFCFLFLFSFFYHSSSSCFFLFFFPSSFFFLIFLCSCHCPGGPPGAFVGVVV